MKTRNATKLQFCLATLLGLGILSTSASAAATDLMTVKLTTPATIGKSTLPAGDYTVRDVQDGGSSAVLAFTSANGHTVNALVREIDVPGSEDATRSSVVLRSEAGGYLVDKVWVEGKAYGFQLVTADR